MKSSALNSSPVQLQKKSRRKTELVEIDVVDEYRRAFGTYELCRVMGMEKPVAGKSYHIMTGGNVDLLAHLQWALLHWKRVERVFISAWAISGADILLCKRYLEEGSVGTLELLLGDIFPSKYKMEWQKLMEMYDAGIITNIYNSTIHSKVLLIDCGEEKVVVESSANCNMNPRVEQSCITVSNQLFEFYDVYLHGILETEEARYVARKTCNILAEKNYGKEAEIGDDERAAIERQD